MATTTPIFDVRDRWPPLAAGNRLVTVVTTERTNTWRTNHTQLIMMRLILTKPWYVSLPSPKNLMSFAYFPTVSFRYYFQCEVQWWCIARPYTSAGPDFKACTLHSTAIAEGSYHKSIHSCGKSSSLNMTRNNRNKGDEVGVKRKDITQAAAICPPAVGHESYSISSTGLNISKFVH